MTWNDFSIVSRQKQVLCHALYIFHQALTHLSLMLLLCKECKVGGSLSCSAPQMLFQLLLPLAGDIGQQLAALQCLHLIRLLPQLCMAVTKHLMQILGSMQEYFICTGMAWCSH